MHLKTYLVGLLKKIKKNKVRTNHTTRFIHTHNHLLKYEGPVIERAPSISSTRNRYKQKKNLKHY